MFLPGLRSPQAEAAACLFRRTGSSHESQLQELTLLSRPIDLCPLTWSHLIPSHVAPAHA